MDEHIHECVCVSLGVLVLSWYPPGLADDNGEPAEDLVPAVLDAAYRHNLKVECISTFCLSVRETIKIELRKRPRLKKSS